MRYFDSTWLFRWRQASACMSFISRAHVQLEAKFWYLRASEMNRRKMKHVLWMLLGCSPTLHSSDRNQLILHPIFLPANSKLEMSERCRMMHCWQRTSATTLSTLPGPYYPVALGRKTKGPMCKRAKIGSTWINTDQRICGCTNLFLAQDKKPLSRGESRRLCPNQACGLSPLAERINGST